MDALSAVLDLDGLTDSGEVIVPNYTYIGSASAFLDMQCTVALVDIEPDTFTLSPQAVEQAIDPKRTRAIIAVHMPGQPSDMTHINAIAKQQGLKVIEDGVQAHGAICGGKVVSGIGDVAGFSFQSSKNLCCGEGGAATTKDKDVHVRAVGLMNTGRLPEGERWKYHRIGWNYRLSKCNATLLTVRFEDIKPQTQDRDRMADLLSSQLAEITGVSPPKQGRWCTRHAYHIYPMLIEPDPFGGRSRDNIIKVLNAEGIPIIAG